MTSSPGLRLVDDLLTAEREPPRAARADAAPDIFYTPAPRRDYRAADSRLKSLGATVSIYGVVAAVLLLSISVSFVKPVPPQALTVMNTQAAASPPETPPKEKDAPKPVEKKEVIQQPVKTEPLPPMKVSISPIVAPVPVIVPKQAEPAPREPETAAPKTAPAPPAPRIASNGPDTWEGRVLMQLSKKRHYPMGAMARHEQGVPYIRFVMDRQGKVLSVSLERSSGVSELDREALSLPKRAQPLPKPPEDRPGETLELVVPVEFFIR
ncbi:energy transducer TonB family protein [Novosphingobium terrae]|jgi:periplasmic protein TonB|uniref:energy transducer TonB family protein n=1 Tax=Novosphingobium terrae TaxID=2726189 RepID=UPI00197F4AA4|nr:TonB family protein [Novosphingobium terrae]